MAKYLCKEDQSNKFWEYKIDGNNVLVKWGRVGLDGQAKVHHFDNPADVERFITKKTREKERKGYNKVDAKELKQETQTAQQLGHQYKISRMLFVSQKGNKLTRISKYDPKKWVYVEILNSWKKDIVRLLLSKTESFKIAGGITESSGTITYGHKTQTSGNFVDAVRGVLRRLSEQVVEAIKTIKFAAVGARNLFDENGSPPSHELSEALESVDTTGIDEKVVSNFACVGARVLEL